MSDQSLTDTFEISVYHNCLKLRNTNSETWYLKFEEVFVLQFKKGIYKLSPICLDITTETNHVSINLDTKLVNLDLLFERLTKAFRYLLEQNEPTFSEKDGFVKILSPILLLSKECFFFVESKNRTITFF